MKSNETNHNGSGAGSTGATDSVKATEVELPKATVNAIAKDTNADLVIKTDNGEVVLDNKTLETIAGAAKGDTVTIVDGRKHPAQGNAETGGEDRRQETEPSLIWQRRSAKDFCTSSRAARRM